MCKTATLTFSLSTDPRVAHIGEWFADLRVSGRQTTCVGTEKDMQKFLDDVRKACTQHEVALTVKNDTLGELHIV